MVSIHPNGQTATRKTTSDRTQFNEYGGDSFLDAGLRAIVRGWPIFPCNGKKEPLTLHGYKDSSINEQQVREWATKNPGGLWGYALPKEIVVVDLDMKHGKNGIHEFEELQGYHPEQFDAPIAATATAGLHLYTAANGREYKNSTDLIAKGVDTRTSGGCDYSEWS
jgi:hypothetical protein